MIFTRTCCTVCKFRNPVVVFTPLNKEYGFTICEKCLTGALSFIKSSSKLYKNKIKVLEMPLETFCDYLPKNYSKRVFKAFNYPKIKLGNICAASKSECGRMIGISEKSIHEIEKVLKKLNLSFDHEKAKKSFISIGEIGYEHL